MSGSVTVDPTATTATTPTELKWRADSPDGDRHAFPDNAGFPARAVCGARWTARMGHHGAAWCAGCADGLKEQLRAVTAALAVLEATDQRGDHFAGMSR